MNPPNSPLGPAPRSGRTHTDTIITPPRTVVHRTIDLNPWLLFLVILLSVPAGLWCNEHWVKKEIAPPTAVPAIPSLPAASAASPAPVPESAPVVESPAPADAPAPPVAAKPSVAIVPTAPATSTSMPEAIAPKPAANQVPAGYHRIAYAVYTNYNGDSLRAKFTDEQGRIIFQTINGSWKHEAIIKNGTTVVFGVSLTQPGTTVTYVRVEIMLDGALWKSEQATGSSAEPLISGVIPD